MRNNAMIQTNYVHFQLILHQIFIKLGIFFEKYVSRVYLG